VAAATDRFDYREVMSRNIGFVTEAEQERLRAGRVFVCGTGGMGEACLQTLARAGLGAVEIADLDRFEASNLNRQVFSTLADLGEEKTAVTARRLREFRPDLDLTVHGADWLLAIDAILERCPVVVNGMDDLASGIALYRAARRLRATVIDAYTSTLPSVVRVGPDDPRPEERLGWPTAGVEAGAITPAMLERCRLLEIEYVLVHSSTADAIDWNVASEIIAGKRPRISFAPMVITTGNLLAWEAIHAVIGRPRATDCRGWFLNPHRGRVERPHGWPVAAIRRALVRRALRQVPA